MQIGFWGDSITVGRGDSSSLGWVGRFAKHYFEIPAIEIYNRGVCGDSTTDLLQRFSTEAASLEPSIVVFAIGINDSKYPKGSVTNYVSLEQCKTNISELISQAQKHTSLIFIVGATKVSENAPLSAHGSRFANEDIQKYNAGLMEIAQQHTIPFIQVFDLLDPDTDLYDGLHPNASGYEKLFSAIAPALKYLIQ